MELIPIAKASKSRIPLDEIDPETIKTVEEVYEFCQANPDQRIQTPDFATKEAAERFLREARSYAYARPDGRVVVTGNPASGTVKGTYNVRFSVDPYVAPETDDDE